AHVAAGAVLGRPRQRAGRVAGGLGGPLVPRAGEPDGAGGAGDRGAARPAAAGAVRRRDGTGEEFRVMAREHLLKVGVSGIRGVVGAFLTPSLACSFAQAFGTYVGEG